MRCHIWPIVRFEVAVQAAAVKEGTSLKDNPAFKE